MMPLPEKTFGKRHNVAEPVAGGDARYYVTFHNLRVDHWPMHDSLEKPAVGCALRTIGRPGASGTSGRGRPRY